MRMLHWPNSWMLSTHYLYTDLLFRHYFGQNYQHCTMWCCFLGVNSRYQEKVSLTGSIKMDHLTCQTGFSRCFKYQPSMNILGRKQEVDHSIQVFRHLCWLLWPFVRSDFCLIMLYPNKLSLADDRGYYFFPVDLRTPPNQVIHRIGDVYGRNSCKPPLDVWKNPMEKNAL